MDKLDCILLVDDDETTNYVNQMLLEDIAVTKEVRVARNGKEALEIIQRQGEEGVYPDLILLDINMPVMNGFEFLEAYERLDFRHKQSVVIVMLTTSLDPGDLNRLREVPLKGFLNKPLTGEMVQGLLRQHFGRDVPG